MVVYDFPDIFRDTSNTNSKTFSANRLSSFTAERPRFSFHELLTWGSSESSTKAAYLEKSHPFNSPLLGNLIILVLSQIFLNS